MRAVSDSEHDVLTAATFLPGHPGALCVAIMTPESTDGWVIGAAAPGSDDDDAREVARGGGDLLRMTPR